MKQAVNIQLNAFLAGAKWWEWRKEGATMWQSDQAEVMAEAERRYQKPLPVNLSKMLKEIRAESGMSMRELSKASGVPKSAISNLESGKITNPCVDTVEKLAVAMGYKVELLFSKEKG